MTDVYVEAGAKRTFAGAVDWPGWCRSGKDEGLALEALAAYAPRYQVVAGAGGVKFPAAAAKRFDVVARLPGSASTDFGVPGSIGAFDEAPRSKRRLEIQVALVRAAWQVLDAVAAAAPASLRKGPRGGGRDRDAIVEHVLAAEAAYARKLGLRIDQADAGDRAGITAARSAIADVLRTNQPPVVGKRGGKGWPVGYAARRIAWHALDHAWEIEDRSD